MQGRPRHYRKLERFSLESASEGWVPRVARPPVRASARTAREGEPPVASGADRTQACRLCSQRCGFVRPRGPCGPLAGATRRAERTRRPAPNEANPPRRPNPSCRAERTRGPAPSEPGGGGVVRSRTRATRRKGIIPCDLGAPRPRPPSWGLLASQSHLPRPTEANPPRPTEPNPTRPNEANPPHPNEANFPRRANPTTRRRPNPSVQVCPARFGFVRDVASGLARSRVRFVKEHHGIIVIRGPRVLRFRGGAPGPIRRCPRLIRRAGIGRMLGPRSVATGTRRRRLGTDREPIVAAAGAVGAGARAARGDGGLAAGAARGGGRLGRGDPGAASEPGGARGIGDRADLRRVRAPPGTRPATRSRRLAGAVPRASRAAGAAVRPPRDLRRLRRNPARRARPAGPGPDLDPAGRRLAAAVRAVRPDRGPRARQRGDRLPGLRPRGRAARGAEADPRGGPRGVRRPATAPATRPTPASGSATRTSSRSTNSARSTGCRTCRRNTSTGGRWPGRSPGSRSRSSGRSG